MTVPLIALTSYYNPFHGERRRHNYRVFRENLGVPLVTVEWSPDGRFDLNDGDADVLIRIDGGDLMWQKERLLNRGLSHIRAGALARDVAIVDADVVFDSADWHLRVSAALDAIPLVHCQARVDYLDELPAHVRSRAELAGIEPERTVGSLAFALSQGKPLFTDDPATVKALAVAGFAPSSGATGMALALRLADMPHFELYDGNIVGGGDLLICVAALGRLQELFDVRNYSARHQQDARAWAERCLPDQHRIGWADNRAMHLWHGEMEARQYGERMHILAPRNYDPAVHLDRGGAALRFMPGASEIQAAVAAYLASRNDA